MMQSGCCIEFSQRRCYLRCCLLLITFCVFLPPASCVSLNSSLVNGSLACPGQQIRFICNVNSPQLVWNSIEFIGPPGIRIEFSSLDEVGSIKTGRMGTNATLLGLSGINVTSSELRVYASQDFPTTASVTCADSAGSLTIEFQVPDVPGMPRNVRAIQKSQLSDNCTIYLHWDPPDGIMMSYISHYSIDYLPGEFTIFSLLTEANLLVEECALNITFVMISAIDICNRTGNNTNDTLAELLSNTTTSQTEPSTTVTTASATIVNPTSIGIVAIVMSVIIAALLAVVIIVIGACIYWSRKSSKGYWRLRSLVVGDDQTDTTNGNVIPMTTRMTKMDAETKVVKAKVGNLEETVMEMDEVRLQNIKTQVSDQGKTLEKTVKHMDKHTEMLEDVTTKVSDQGKTLEKTVKHMDKHTKMLEDVTTKVSHQGKTLEKTVKHMDKRTKMLEGVTTKVGELEETVMEMDEDKEYRLQNIETQMNQLKTALSYNMSGDTRAKESMIDFLQGHSDLDDDNDEGNAA